MREDPDVSPLEFVLEECGCRLVIEAGNDDRAHIDAPTPQVVDQLHCVGVVGNAEVGPNLFALDVPRINAEQNVRLILEFPDQPHFHVGIVARKHAGRMVIEEELPAELEIELVVELLHTLDNFRRLFLDVALVVESDSAGHEFLETSGGNIYDCLSSEM